MRFKISHNAYVKVPTEVGEGVVKNIDTFIKAEPSAPAMIEFPSNLPLDSVSRRWEALDDEAKALQAKLTPIVPAAEVDAPIPVDAASVLAAIGNLSDEEKGKLIAGLGGGKPKAKKADAE